MKQLRLALMVALAFSLLSPTYAQGGPPQTGGPQNNPHLHRGKHPEIRQAINKLRMDKMHLEQAAHDFGGHRVDAIKAIDTAIGQLEICLKYD